MGYKEEQLSFLPTPKARGGKRPGAGRKAKRGSTIVMRVPEAYKPAVERLIELLDEVNVEGEIATDDLLRQAIEHL